MRGFVKCADGWAGVGAPLPKKDTFESVTPFEERLAALRPGG